MRIARTVMVALLAAGSCCRGQTKPSGIAIPFDLHDPGFVTLVIDNADGTRVRNLISETPFPSGHNIAWWDGLDDLGRNVDAATHSIYDVPGKLVDPGAYRVRGLVRPPVDIRYLMTPYNPGRPAWHTTDRASGWLANHTPPSAVLWVPDGAAPPRPLQAKGPQILVSSYVTEGGSGLAWLDEDGHKLFGQTWLGGVWTAASQLARDRGEHPTPGVYAYAAAFWPGDKYNKNIPEIRLSELVNGSAATAPSDTRFGTGDDRAVLKPNFQLPNVARGKDSVDLEKSKLTGLKGMAVRDGIVVLSINLLDRLAFVDAKQKAVLGLAKLDNPRGVEFDANGRLLVLSGKTLLRFDLPTLPTAGKFDVTSADPNISLPPPQTLVADGLEDPQQIAVGPTGNIFISDWGESNRVKVFDANGKSIRAIGKPGPPAIGPYDPDGMRHPNGMTIDDRGRLWVAETDKAPKRVSIWNAADGSFIDALYGPTAYGGGGCIDPVDPTRFFYVDEGGGQEMSLDYAHGTSSIVSVYWRPDVSEFPIHGRWVGAGPETPIHFHDELYLTDCFTTSATSGVRAASIWKLRDGVATPVAAAGDIHDSASVLFPIFSTPPFASRLPAKTDVIKDHIVFAWSDRNGDGKMDADETTFFRPSHETIHGATLVDGVTVQPDLSFAVAVCGDEAIVLHPQSFTTAGVPIFDAAKHDTIATTVNRAVSSGHQQVLLGDDGWNILTTPPQPLSPYGLGGVRDGKPVWSYPSMWPGLHASHIAPLANQLGEVIGTTRLLGRSFKVTGSDLGELWAINGNKGQAYVFTTDGLFVTSLFHDSRAAAEWPPTAIAGEDLTGVSLAEEDFFPTITATTDGRLLMQVGADSNIVQVNGLRDAHRLPDTQVTVTKEQLIDAQQLRLDAESRRQAERGSGSYTVAIKGDDARPHVDGALDDWGKVPWMLIDERQVQVGNWGRRKTKTEAALVVAGDRLYGALRADNPDLLSNSGESTQNLFKTGGAIDLMIGTDATAPDDRKSPGPGDRRLVITRVNGKPMAVLYEQTQRDFHGQPIEFASPLRSLHFASVKDVSDPVQLASATVKDKDNVPSGVYEFSIPLAVLGLNETTGRYRGDIGVLRGNAFTTVERSYWSNKASGLVSDLPSEAELQPSLWGHFNFAK